MSLAGVYLPGFLHAPSTDLKKTKLFLKQATDFVDLISPKAFAPFAGTYILGSRFSDLSEYTGVPSVQEATTAIQSQTKTKSNGVVLRQGDVLEVADVEITRTMSENEISLDSYKEVIAAKPLDYDNDNWDDMELTEIVGQAYQRFKNKTSQIGFHLDTVVIIETGKISFKFSINDEPVFCIKSKTSEKRFLNISLDHNLLHRLIRGPRFAHWNNAETGSHLTFDRKPNVYERGLFYSLCFFHM